MPSFSIPRSQGRACTVLSDTEDSRSPDDLLTTKEVSEQYSFAVATLRNWRWKRQGPTFIRAESKAIRYRRSDIEQWLKRSRVEPQ